MTGALTWARLGFRQQRWELILVALGVAAVAIGMLWFASQLTGMRAASPDCVPPAAAGPACQAALNAYSQAEGLALNLLLLSFGAPFGIGVLLGAPLIAREIDGGTAQLAWSIGRSRTWWLLRRIAFVTLFAVLALGILAITSEILAAALAPERNLASDFAWFGRRGWLIVARGVGALMLGMLVGALIGRVLPAILAAGLVLALAFTGLSVAQDRWLESLAQTSRMNYNDANSTRDPGALVLNTGVELASGEILTWPELEGRGLEITYIDEQGWLYASEQDMQEGNVLGYDVEFAIPGPRYGDVLAVVGAASIGVGLVALGLTAVVVHQRRPV
jgi:ABC-type transport system involved in multi-copper enzyme maturation permease subunit